MKKICFLSLLLILSVFVLQAQGLLDGFSKGKGSFQLAPSVSLEKYNSYLTANQELFFSRSAKSFSLYTAYGISNRLDVAFSLPYVYVNALGNGLQDAALGAKFRVVSLQKGLFYLDAFAAMTYTFPTSNYNTEDFSAIGQRAKVLAPRAILQLKHSKGFFMALQLAYAKVSLPTPNRINASVKLGWASEQWYTDVWFDYQKSQGGFSYRDGFAQPFRSFGVDYQAIGATLYRPISTHVGVSIAFAKFLAGRNIGLSNRLSLGMVFKV